MSWLYFCCSGVLFAFVGSVHAKRMGDAFNAFILIPFAAAAIAAIAVSGPRTTVPVCLVLASVCVCAASDSSSGYVYDVVTYPSLLFVLLASVYAGTLSSTALWACLSFASLALFAVLTRQRAFGFGDVKLFTVVGAGLGPLFFGVLGGAFVIGACVVAVALLRGRIRFGETVPFAPFIAIATILSLPCERLLG